MSSSRDPHARSSPRSHGASSSQTSASTSLTPSFEWVPLSDPLELRKDLLTHRRGHRTVMGELHRERCSSLGERSKVGSISKHTREGNLSCDHTGPPPVFSFRCLASSGVKIAHDLAHKLFGGDDLDRHPGFKKNRGGSPGTFLETDRTGNLE